MDSAYLGTVTHFYRNQALFWISICITTLMATLCRSKCPKNKSHRTCASRIDHGPELYPWSGPKILSRVTEGDLPLIAVAFGASLVLVRVSGL